MIDSIYLMKIQIVVIDDSILICVIILYPQVRFNSKNWIGILVGLIKLMKEFCSLTKHDLCFDDYLSTNYDLSMVVNFGQGALLYYNLCSWIFFFFFSFWPSLLGALLLFSIGHHQVTKCGIIRPLEFCKKKKKVSTTIISELHFLLLIS